MTPRTTDDFYENLIEWGSNNELAVALAKTLFLCINQFSEILEPKDSITSIACMLDSNKISVGTTRNEVRFWYAERSAFLRRMRRHTAQIGTLAWNGHLLSSASRDAKIHNHDVRNCQHHESTLTYHKQEMYGLK